MPIGPKLRAKPLGTPLNIVLVEPEIPPNTGAIARTAAATGSALHLVGQLGFRIDEQSVRRAGLDYWPLVDLHVHPTFEAFLQVVPDHSRLHLFTAGAPRSLFSATFQPGDWLVLGRESVGLSPSMLAQYPTQHIAIPTLGPVRSLNLATAASVATFEALRSLGALESPFLANDAVGDA